MIHLRNFVCCELVEADDFFSLVNVRYKWPEPPDFMEFWLDILNPSEGEVGIKIEIYRGRTFHDTTEEELVVPGHANIQTALALSPANLERKSYTVRAVINGLVAGKLHIDFGASDA